MTGIHLVEDIQHVNARICFLTTLLVVLHHLDVRFNPQMQRANLS